MKIKAFAKLAGLRERVAVYVPSTTDGATAAPEIAEEMTEKAARRLSGFFGGATISPASGAWLSDRHGLVREAVNIVYAFCDPAALDHHAEDVIELAREIKQAMRQESVSLEINNTLYFV